MSLFSERLALARKRIGLTQQDMADCFQITRSAYSAWEIGRNEPPFSFVYDFCRTYKISADYLIGLSDSMDPPMPISIAPTIISRSPYEDLSPESQATIEALANHLRKQEAQNTMTSDLEMRKGG